MLFVSLVYFCFGLFLGGMGALAHELVWAYPEMKVNVFDLPGVVKYASQFQPERLVSGRVTFTSGSITTLTSQNLTVGFIGVTDIGAIAPSL